MKLDGRSLDHKTLENIRLRTVNQIANEGLTTNDAALVLGINVRTIQKWMKKFRDKGPDSLKAIPLKGRPRKLTSRQEISIRKIVVGKNPLQLKFSFALWTREMVQVLIEEKFNVSLSLSSISNLLHDMGLSPQKPKYQAWQQDSNEVEKWKNEDYPKIVKKAKKHGADIYFQDEASIRSDYHAGTTWGERGKTPVVITTGARFSLNMISAISPRGHLRFMVIKDRVNAAVFIEFLKRLVYNAPRPIYLIVDGHPTHKAKKVKQYIESTNGMLTLYFLPAYSPKLNPDESVWREVKTHSIGRKTISGPDHLKQVVTSKLKQLQNSPATLRGLFKSPDLSYIKVP